MTKDVRVIWPIRWTVGFYSGVRYVRAADGEEACELVAEWCIAAMPELIRQHGGAKLEPEHTA